MALMLMLFYSFVFLSTFLLSLLLVRLSIRLAQRWGIVDIPGGRKNHPQPVALLGGLGIYAAFAGVLLLSLAAFLLLESSPFFAAHFDFLVAQSSFLRLALPKLLMVLIAATFMAGIGFVDDRLGERLSYKVKFAAQFLAAAFVVIGGVRTSFMPTIWLNQLISVLWIVGMTNAFNLLDNMDGLAAGVAAICGTLFFIISAEQAQFFNAMILCAFVGAVLGFLWYNFHPASVFMGDTGSLFIGFFLGSLTLSMSYVREAPETPVPVTIIVPLLVLSLPIFDTLSVMLIRWREGRPLFVGDRRHFSHRLVDLGMSQRRAVVFLYFVALCVGAGAVILPYLPRWAAVLVLLQTAAVYGMISFIMACSRKKQLELSGGAASRKVVNQ